MKVPYLMNMIQCSVSGDFEGGYIMNTMISRNFMEYTRFEHLAPTDQMKGLPQPPLELPFDRSWKIVSLPDPKTVNIEPVTVKDAIMRRESIRSYADTPLSLGELSFILWCTQGVKDVIEGSATFRTVPSAGARHAFETWLLVNNVRDLEAGLYRYSALRHVLGFITSADTCADRLLEGCMNQRFLLSGAAMFIWTAVTARMTWRYGDRGYRYLHLDAGHVCQNLYLAAETIGCGACAVGAFYDEIMNAVLGIDGVEQFVIYLAGLGKKKG